jgi:CAAX prenyl protease-like protein
MQFLREKFRASPIYVRCAPFVIFVALTFCQGLFGKGGAYWMYGVKTIIGAMLVWEMRPFVPEMRWAFSLEAVAVGVAVFLIWVGLDPYVPHNFSSSAPNPADAWNPFARYGAGSTTAWFYVGIHLFGSTFVVPPLEEVFYRSFLYRYFVNTKFETLPFKMFHPTSFIVTSLLFGMEHYELVQGILCGMAFQWLVINKNRLGDAMAAHAITNFLLGLWVVFRGDWHFW